MTTAVPSLSDPCPRAPHGRHELYINAGPSGKRHRVEGWVCCEACGANGPSPFRAKNEDAAPSDHKARVLDALKAFDEKQHAGGRRKGGKRRGR